MADTPETGFQNKKLLLIAGGLALLFVILLNVKNIREQRERASGMVQLVLVQSDLQPGDVLTEFNCSPVSVERATAKKLVGYVRWNEIRDTLASKQEKVRMVVQRNQLLDATHIRGGGLTDLGSARQPTEGFRPVTIKLARDSVPGQFIGVDVRADLIGKLRSGSRILPRQTIIEGLLIVGVQGRQNPDKSWRNVDSVTVEVPADIATLLIEARDRLIGGAELSIRNVNDKNYTTPYNPSDKKMGGRFSDRIRRILETPESQSPSVYEPGPIDSGL